MKLNDLSYPCRRSNFPPSLQIQCKLIMENEYNDLLDFNEDLNLSDDDRDSRESLFNARRVVSENGEEEPSETGNRRSRSPIRGPRPDTQDSTTASSKGRVGEPIETIPDIKTR